MVVINQIKKLFSAGNNKVITNDYKAINYFRERGYHIERKQLDIKYYNQNVLSNDFIIYKKEI